jgi:hypothetical protein
MRIWQVGVSDCESSHTICVCATKEIALREMFKKRDELLADWKKMEEYKNNSIKDFCAKNGQAIWKDEMYERMIKNLSHDNYEKWENYPHDVPWICETNVIEE